MYIPAFKSIPCHGKKWFTRSLSLLEERKERIAKDCMTNCRPMAEAEEATQYQGVCLTQPNPRYEGSKNSLEVYVTFVLGHGTAIISIPSKMRPFWFDSLTHDFLASPMAITGFRNDKDRCTQQVRDSFWSLEAFMFVE